MGIFSIHFPNELNNIRGFFSPAFDAMHNRNSKFDTIRMDFGVLYTSGGFFYSLVPNLLNKCRFFIAVRIRINKCIYT